MYSKFCNIYGRTHGNCGGSEEGEISSREERACEKWSGGLGAGGGVYLGPLTSRWGGALWLCAVAAIPCWEVYVFFLELIWKSSDGTGHALNMAFTDRNPLAFATCTRQCQIMYFFITAGFSFYHSIRNCLVCRIDNTQALTIHCWILFHPLNKIIYHWYELSLTWTVKIMSSWKFLFFMHHVFCTKPLELGSEQNWHALCPHGTYIVKNKSLPWVNCSINTKLNILVLVKG